MLISYNWLKSYIPLIPSVEEISDLITFHICEIESLEKTLDGDTIFNLDVLPNRAHDLLSHQGVAREVASLLGKEFKLPVYKIPESKPTDLKIDIETDGCHRYMGRIVRNIKVGPSPEWMVKHLESIGQRSINNIVDATNIVMFDCGQPIHAFDLKKLSTSAIVVKNAKEGESLDLVGSEKITAVLKDTDTMITDGMNNLAIAGVKGGLDSGISINAKDILIEVANFDATIVRKTARRLGILTDASKRYENDLSATLCEFAMTEISALILEMCPEASFEEIIDSYRVQSEQKKVSFTTSYITKNLGIVIKDEEIEKILKNYAYNFIHKSDTWEVDIPPMRSDLTEPCDFIEEIGRAYGYDKIDPKVPTKDLFIKETKDSLLQDNPIWVKISIIKQNLIARGYREVMTYVFRENGQVEVLASASDKGFLRTNLTDGLRESITLNQNNLPLLGDDEVKVFEVGTVFTRHGERINVAYGDKKKIEEKTLEEFYEEIVPDFPSEAGDNYILKTLSNRPKNKKSNKKELTDTHEGEDFEMQIFKPWSVYPFIVRDIAVWVPEGTAPEKLVRIYHEFGTELLVGEPKLFDSFTKDKKTSYAFRLVFQSKDKTLTDEEINKIMEEINEKIVYFGWEVR